MWVDSAAWAWPKGEKARPAPKETAARVRRNSGLSNMVGQLPEFKRVKTVAGRTGSLRAPLLAHNRCFNLFATQAAAGLVHVVQPFERPHPNPVYGGTIHVGGLDMGGQTEH